MRLISKLKKNKCRCPSCGCKDLVRKEFRHDQGFIEEMWYECKSCKRRKYHWAYGYTYVEDWKDVSVPPLKYRIKHFFIKLFTYKKRKNRRHKDDDLPF